MYLFNDVGRNSSYKKAKKTLIISLLKSRILNSKNTDKSFVLSISSDTSMQKNSTKWFTSDITINNSTNCVKPEPIKGPNILPAFLFLIRPFCLNILKPKITFTMPSICLSHKSKTPSPNLSPKTVKDAHSILFFLLISPLETWWQPFEYIFTYLEKTLLIRYHNSKWHQLQKRWMV